MTTLTPEEEGVQQAALDYAKSNKKLIARGLTDPEKFPSERNPVSVFMAGSPGAGKTEASLELVARLDPELPVLIDPDAYRTLLPGYDGNNAYLFQKGVSVLVDKVLDCVFDQSQSFLLDGTLTNFDLADKNIARSLKRGRAVQILYVYQKPELAWKFVQARESAEGRRIPKDRFINQYFAAREVVNRLKAKYDGDIKIDLLIKDNDNAHRNYHFNVPQIDSYVPEAYTKEDIEKLTGTL